MSFRNDHEATLARADALARALEVSEQRAKDAAARLEASERARHQLERRLGVKPSVAVAPPVPPSPAPVAERRASQSDHADCCSDEPPFGSAFWVYFVTTVGLLAIAALPVACHWAATH